MTKLSWSEARAEACTLVLQIMLSDMPARKLKKIRKGALAEAKDIGHQRVSSELNWLFRDCSL